MNRSAGRASRGFATLLAIILIGLVGLALAVMTGLFAQQAKRTEHGRREAQLRQLLAAGAASVNSRCAAWGEQVAERNWPVALPKALSADGASTTARVDAAAASANPAERRAVIEATLDGRTASQSLILARSGGQWRIKQARLGE
jgi:hypothetical protein